MYASFFCLHKLFFQNLQFRHDLEHFEGFYKLLNASFVNGQPRHLSAPNLSCIKVISYAAFKKLPVLQVQNILRDHHIVVEGMPPDPWVFDERGLMELKNLSSVVDLQGLLTASFS